jgi:hypothetical protein
MFYRPPPAGDDFRIEVDFARFGNCSGGGEGSARPGGAAVCIALLNEFQPGRFASGVQGGLAAPVSKRRGGRSVASLESGCPLNPAELSRASTLKITLSFSIALALLPRRRMADFRDLNRELRQARLRRILSAMSRTS